MTIISAIAYACKPFANTLNAPARGLTRCTYTDRGVCVFKRVISNDIRFLSLVEQSHFPYIPKMFFSDTAMAV